MKIEVEDIIADDIDKMPLLENGKSNQSSECIFRSKVRTLKDTRARNKLIVACVICMIFMAGEIVGGIFANSLAILTDSAHLFSDLSSFIIGLVAMILSGRPSSKTMTFGWHRAEVIGALFSVLLIWVVTGVLVYIGILRIINNNFTIDSKVMLIMSGVAVVINIIMAFVLHPHSHTHDSSHSHTHEPAHSHNHSHGHSYLSSEESVDSYQPMLSPVSDSINDDRVKPRGMKTKIQNINLRAAFIHVIGDIVQSFGVLIASIIIYVKPEWKIADPICTFVFSFLVVLTTLSIFLDIICILLERKPRHLCYKTIEDRILKVPGVSRVHNLRLWSITLSITAATCHLIIHDKNRSKDVLDSVNQIMINDFHISDIAIQIEFVGHDSDTYVH